MMIRFLLPLFIAGYLAIIFPLTSYMKNKPVAEKLGYIPRPEVLRLVSADQKPFIAVMLMIKVISYYGGLVEKAQNKIYLPVDYYGMYRTLDTIVKLDPYNMDAYYFVQATVVWEAGQVKAANELLEYGMKYRDWDFYLPYFAGFNYAYFLKDYANAAKYYKRVGELIGTDLPMTLAGRYMYESGRTDLAISYLFLMVKTARNDAIKKTLQARLTAFLEVRRIEEARDHYHKATRRFPQSMEELLQKGYLREKPVDPYGGKFYIDQQGMVRSTSKFAFGVTKRSQ